MKILIVSALFPPDVAQPAPYIKELAQRWSTSESVSVLTYGHSPEQIEGVTITNVSKSDSAPVRLTKFVRALIRLAREHDVIVVHNAPSTELPMIIAQALSRARWLFVNSDTKISYAGWVKRLHEVAEKRVTPYRGTLPLARPEIHPFKPVPETDWQAYEQSWQTHLATLNQCIHGTEK